ncbi:MAG: ATP-binding protein [Chloroflexota bacterium]
MRGFINSPIIADGMEPMEIAKQALAQIGDGWSAGNEEIEVLDFKETPDTAIPVKQRTEVNMGKQRKAFLAAIAQASACLANSRGGIIAIGVRDKAKTRVEALPGADPAYYSLDAIRLAVHRGTLPPLTVDPIEWDEDGTRLVLVQVPRGAVVHGTTDGTYKRRVVDQCRPIGEAEMRGLQATRGQYDWSSEPSDCGLDALSQAALVRAVERLRDAGFDDQASLAEDDPEHFLSNCDLIAGSRLRRAAVLLYGDAQALRKTVPDWGVILTTASSPGAEGSVVLRREDSERRPIMLLVDDILARIGALASAETIRVSGTQVELVDYPQDVVRELAANAFAHRDWELPGIIEISHSPDELAFSSPGGLLPTLHPDRLLRETAQRNRRLAGEIARLRIAEGAGLGFDRVWRLLAGIGKEPPRIADGPRFTVTVPGGQGDSAFARFLRGSGFPADSKLASDLDVLLVLAALRSERRLNAEKAVPLLQRDLIGCQRVLDRMCDAELLEPTRGTARRQHPSYKLSQAALAGMRTALTYRAETIDSDDAKLIRHLKRHRRISNEDVRNYLDCDVPTARNRLTRMRRKGWIEFAPESPKRGPHVEYAATEKVDALGG